MNSDLEELKLHLQTEYPEQTTDGLGIRYSIYTQGCRGGLFGQQISNCKGCHNPETWSFNAKAPGSYFVTIPELIQKMQKHPLSWGKLTLCGGDPIWQAKSCTLLIRELKKLKNNFNVWAYTGLTLEYIIEQANAENAWREYLESIDVLIDGPFLLSKRDISLSWRGSSNQRIIDVQKTLKSRKIQLVKLDEPC